MRNEHWILCPTCGSKTRDKIREDTVLKNFPLYCPKCKQESLIEVENLNIVVIKALSFLSGRTRCVTGIADKQRII